MHEAFTITSEVSSKTHCADGSCLGTTTTRAEHARNAYAEPNHGGRLSRSDRSFGHGIRVAPSTTQGNNVAD